MNNVISQDKMNTEEIRAYYDSEVPKKYFDNYEYYRWFSTKKNWEEYRMTFETLNKAVSKVDLAGKRGFELGPGAGTWTKLFMIKGIGSMALLDQSKYMLGQARINLGERENIKFIESDFSIFDNTEKYDLFFSARTIEYIPDKEDLVNKIFNILNNNGFGLIITKNPINKIKLFKRRQHKNQISPNDLKKLFVNRGFVNVSVVPAVIRFPLGLNVGFLNAFIYRLIKNKKLNYFLSLITESYLISFEK